MKCYNTHCPHNDRAYNDNCNFLETLNVELCHKFYPALGGVGSAYKPKDLEIQKIYLRGLLLPSVYENMENKFNEIIAVVNRLIKDSG